ncbi:hypothetical protein TKK_0016710 [Trichogramma kaykai]
MMTSDSSDEENEIVPELIRQAARDVTLNLLPEKWKRLYTQAYNKFKEWQKDRKTNSFDEDVLLVYFSTLSTNYKPPSLWSKYSMLKSTINCYNNINIGNYKRLTAYLKKCSKGYIRKKSKEFTNTEILTFLNEAPDEKNLCLKVILIFGISGALRRSEFAKLKINDVKEYDDVMIVSINLAKNETYRKFTISGAMYDICKKYIKLRPSHCTQDRFFIRYDNGECINRPIGVNTFGGASKKIAEYLKLPDAHNYTGHSFRRSSATMLADAGADQMTMRRHGGWKSDAVVYEYIAESISNKKNIHKKICSGITINQETVPNSSKQIQDSAHSAIDTTHLNKPSTSKQPPNLKNIQVIARSHNVQSTTITQDPEYYENMSILVNSSHAHEVSENIEYYANSHQDISTRKVKKNVTSNTELERTHANEKCKNATKHEDIFSSIGVYYDPDLGLYILDNKTKCNCQK